MMDLDGHLTSKGVRIDAIPEPTFEQLPGSFLESEGNGHDIRSINLYIQEKYGRFGNNIYQILHAIIVARRLNIAVIYCSFFLDEAKTPSITVGDVVIVFGMEQPPAAPRLSVTMFHPHGFEEIVASGLSSDQVKQDAESISRAIFKNEHRRLAQPPKKIVVFHFRSGDIFSPTGHINSLYVQPPLSYYTKSLDHIISTITNVEIFELFEHDRNPCIKAFQDVLTERGISFISQSSTFYEDALLMVSADCIVSSFSSFCEALALMSENLSRWYSFRSLAVYEDVSPSVCQSFSKILIRDAVEFFLVNDQDNSYTRKGNWVFSSSQVEQMLNYPVDHLSLNLLPNLR